MMNDTCKMKVMGSIFNTNGRYVDSFVLTFSKPSEEQLRESFPSVVLDYFKKRGVNNQILVSTQIRCGNIVKLGNYEAKIENGELKLEPFLTKEVVLHTNESGEI